MGLEGDMRLTFVLHGLDDILLCFVCRCSRYIGSWKGVRGNTVEGFHNREA